MSICYSPTKQHPEMIKIKVLAEDGRDLVFYIEYKDSAQLMALDLIEKLKLDLPEFEFNLTFLEQLIQKKIEAQQNLILETNNTHISSKKQPVSPFKIDKKKYFSFNVQPISHHINNKSSILLKNKKRRSVIHNVKEEKLIKKTLKLAKAKLSKILPNYNDKVVIVNREPNVFRSSKKSGFDNEKINDFTLISDKNTNIFNFNKKSPSESEASIEEESKKHSSNNLAPTKHTSNLVYSENHYNINSNNINNNNNSSSNTSRREASKDEKLKKQKLTTKSLKPKSKLKSRKAKVLSELNKNTIFIPSFDYLCVTKRKLARFITEKQYLFTKDCAVCHVENISYYKKEKFQRRGDDREIGNTTYLDQTFMNRTKFGTKRLGYSQIAAKNLFKKQESIISTAGLDEQNKGNQGNKSQKDEFSTKSIFNMNFINKDIKKKNSILKKSNDLVVNFGRRSSVKKATQSYVFLANEKELIQSAFKRQEKLKNILSTQKSKVNSNDISVIAENNPKARIKKGVKIEVNERKFNQKFKRTATSKMSSKTSFDTINKIDEYDSLHGNAQGKEKEEPKVESTKSIDIKLDFYDKAADKTEKDTKSIKKSKLSIKTLDTIKSPDNYVSNKSVHDLNKVKTSPERRGTIKLPVSSNNQLADLSFNLIDLSSKYGDTQPQGQNNVDTISSNENNNSFSEKVKSEMTIRNDKLIVKKERRASKFKAKSIIEKETVSLDKTLKHTINSKKKRKVNNEYLARLSQTKKTKQYEKYEKQMKALLMNTSKMSPGKFSTIKSIL